MFKAWQIIIILILCLGDVAVLTLGMVYAFKCKSNFARQLCTIQMQQRREELLTKLDAMRNGRYAFGQAVDIEYDADEADEDDADDNDEDDEDEAEDGECAPLTEAEAAAAEENVRNGVGMRLRILPVREMTGKMRVDFALTGIEYDDKRYYARYGYSFEAKLRGSDDSVKQFYTELMNEIGMYKGLKTRVSAKQIRITKGRNTLGMIVFRGRSLWMAFALDPAEYAETKYRGKDMSEVKRFEQTPMLLKISSRKKLRYAQILLAQLAEKNTLLINDAPEVVAFDLAAMSDGELYDAGLLRIKLAGEAPAPEGSAE